MGRSHEIDYQIKGESIQIVEVELDPMETVIAEAGAMLFMEDGIQFEAKMGDGSNPNQGLFDKLLSVGSRVLTGESIFMTHFTNRGNRRAKVGFSAPYPGTVIPIDLSQCPSNQLIVQKDGFLCAAMGTQISITFNRKLGSGLVAGTCACTPVITNNITILWSENLFFIDLVTNYIVETFARFLNINEKIPGIIILIIKR